MKTVKIPVHQLSGIHVDRPIQIDSQTEGIESLVGVHLLAVEHSVSGPRLYIRVWGDDTLWVDAARHDVVNVYDVLDD